MSVARTLVFDRAGRPRAEIAPAWNSFAWRLNNESRASFSMPYTDSRARRDLLAPGYFVLAEFDNGLPAWAGVMDLPPAIDPEGVRVIAYSGEHLMTWRCTSRDLRLENEAPGDVYRALIDEMNSKIATLRPGAIFDGGAKITREYHLHTIFDVVSELAAITSHDFYVRPSYEAGELRFYANWLERRGGDRASRVLLTEGRNLSAFDRSPQGSLASQVLVAGGGDGWGNVRYVADVENPSTEDAYGFRQFADVDTSSIEQNAIDARARSELENRASPSQPTTLIVTNAEPGAFRTYDVGDIVRAQFNLQYPEWFVDESVRVLAREYDPVAETCRLEVVTWRE